MAVCGDPIGMYSCRLKLHTVIHQPFITKLRDKYDGFTVEVSRKIDGQDLTQQELADFLLEQGYEIMQFEKEFLVSKNTQ